MEAQFSRDPQWKRKTSTQISNSFPLSLVGCDPCLPWLPNSDLWLPDGPKGFTCSHAKIPLSYLFPISVNKILCFMSQPVPEDNKTSSKESTTEVSHRQPQRYSQDKPLFHPPSWKKCQGAMSNNCSNPGAVKGRDRKPAGQGYSLNICPFGFWRLHLTLISFCYSWASTQGESLLAILHVSVSQ